MSRVSPAGSKDDPGAKSPRERECHRAKLPRHPARRTPPRPAGASPLRGAGHWAVASGESAPRPSQHVADAARNPRCGPQAPLPPPPLHNAPATQAQHSALDRRSSGRPARGRDCGAAATRRTSARLPAGNGASGSTSAPRLRNPRASATSPPPPPPTTKTPAPLPLQSKGEGEGPATAQDGHARAIVDAPDQLAAAPSPLHPFYPDASATAHRLRP
ncbi:hypothetical protein FB451DRAFT_1420470 [Mycena latifolia]|nr:hypothetical protein FB451DRAFT_1420470 [Mycena latifolia]